MSDIDFEVSVDKGEYVFRAYSDGRFECLRHGELWLSSSWPGERALYAFALELKSTREKLWKAQADASRLRYPDTTGG